MTLGAGYAEQTDLAALLGAAEDRALTNALSGTVSPHASFEVTTGLDPSDGVNYSGGSSYSPALPLAPSSAGLVGVGGIETEIRRSEAYLRRQAGRSWPSTETPYHLRPTVSSRVSDINEGWNAAAQPGPPPGYDSVFAESVMGGGGLTYEEAMQWSPAPLTQATTALGAPVAEGQRLDGIYQEPMRELRPGFGEERPFGAVVMPLVLVTGTLLWLTFKLAGEPER